jgi:hypothetical protein
LLLLEHGLSGSMQSAMLSTENSFDNICQILEHVKAISYLHRHGSPASDSLGIGAGPITGDERDR